MNDTIYLIYIVRAEILWVIFQSFNFALASDLWKQGELLASGTVIYRGLWQRSDDAVTCIIISLPLNQSRVLFNFCRRRQSRIATKHSIEIILTK